MAKDPAFLFYPNDWLGGTLTFSRHLKGCYIDLLMAQFNQGRLSIQDVQDILGADFDLHWERKLKSKFIEDESGRFYNERLENEKNKRANFTQSRRNNKSGHQLHMTEHMKEDMLQHMKPHMVNVNINTNKNINVNKIVLPFEEKNFNEAWDIWIQYRKEIRKPYKSEKSETTALKQLGKFNVEFAIHLIERSIANGWQGLVFDNTEKEFKQFNNGQTTGNKQHPLESIRALAGKVLQRTPSGNDTTGNGH